MYKSLTKTKKKYSGIEAHETLKRVASANAIIKHYKSYSLITVKRHAMVLSFFGTQDLFNISYSRELYLFSKFLRFEEIVRVKMAVCFEMIVSET